jgi:hypothetical protein
MNEPRHLPSPPALHCLGGKSAPAPILADLAALLRLPRAAQEHFWEALGPALQDPAPPGLAEVLDAFCQEQGVTPADLGRAIKASRFLFREATRRDLDRRLFAADLAAVSPADEALGAILLPRYEEARQRVGHELAARSIAGHGKILLDVEWRTDTVTASNHGAGLQAKVAFLTLLYEDNGRRETITVQALPSVLRKLEASCRQLLG